MPLVQPQLATPLSFVQVFFVWLAVAETCMRVWEKQLLRLQVRADDVESVGMRMFRSRKEALLVNDDVRVGGRRFQELV